MKKADICKIESFIDNEISKYDIKFDYEVENSVMEAYFTGHFTNNNEINLSFKIIDDKINVYSVCESYINCGTREFWIELMVAIHE